MGTHQEAIDKNIRDMGIGAAPRLTPDDIANAIADITFHRHKTLTICILELRNGYLVTGESACASPENYNQEIGQNIAFENAKQKIWALEGYLLKTRLADRERMGQEPK